ncbi:MAG: hypothetical protein H6558_02005 [Lewinellaceae bacterium]|nr:hypothetical protein [Lewinellaceae bacterium]MCB9286810.1 hypothetical protein [Lewinellaceae bacterium]
MIKDEKGKALHDKASRGEKLSEQEQRQLEDWYAQQDKMELESIQLSVGEESLSDLQAQVEAALAQLVKLTNRIQQVASENEQLRNENTTLLYQLTKQLGQRPA